MAQSERIPATASIILILHNLLNMQNNLLILFYIYAILKLLDKAATRRGELWPLTAMPVWPDGKAESTSGCTSINLQHTYKEE